MGNSEMKVRRPAREVAKELWHQKPGSRADRPMKPRAIGAKEIVNGLDRREIFIGSFLTAVAVGLAVLGYFNEHGSSDPTLHRSASTVLFTMLIGALLLAVGLGFRRRALLGFAAFLFGLEQWSFKFYEGSLLYLAFGGWLIYRVTQKTKADRAAGVHTGTIDTGPRFNSSEPRASKRYTPPKKGRRR